MARLKLTSPLTATPKRDLPRRRRAWLIGAAAVSLVGVGVWVVLNREGGATAPGGSPTSVGLPDTPDYHSLLVDPTNSERVTLGTHAGLFKTVDGGRTWRAAELSGQDAMNLVRTKGPFWTAGHDVLARSDDDGTTWRAVRPRGLPSLDVHGFAAHPRGGGAFRCGRGAGSVPIRRRRPDLHPRLARRRGLGLRTRRDARWHAAGRRHQPGAFGKR